jgi:hypothetical protein
VGKAIYSSISNRKVIGSVLLAPAGVVTAAYPLAGGPPPAPAPAPGPPQEQAPPRSATQRSPSALVPQPSDPTPPPLPRAGQEAAIGHNLFCDERCAQLWPEAYNISKYRIRRADVLRAISRAPDMTLGGPYALIQGGVNAIARLPWVAHGSGSACLPARLPRLPACLPWAPDAQHPGSTRGPAPGAHPDASALPLPASPTRPQHLFALPPWHQRLQHLQLQRLQLQRCAHGAL